MDKEKNCINCKYYHKLFTIHKTRLKEVGGRCLHNKIAPHYYNKIFYARNDCKYWEEGGNEKGKTITEEIHEMNRRLRDIALILKSE